ncbi:MAG: M6 family metalloprotease domain-containing protein [Fibromonadales bacterium]|nr:M6 family metalloprotease domain-containing protein [Fibromonadales bacterium]MCL2208204.1 M6 family metalloprotease domain-containing protein [Fibromonadales bacterium]
MRLFIAILFAAFFNLFAAPHNGEEFELAQPDGSVVPVLIFGDEFYQDVESHDGFTLVRDKEGWICYAELSADGSEYVPTEVRYTGKKSKAPDAQRKKRISKKSFHEKHRRVREALGHNDFAPLEASDFDSPMVSNAPPEGISPAAAEAKRIVGLTLLINFPDSSAKITKETMEEFLNSPGGYQGKNAAGSVSDYFRDVSNGLLEYTNIVAPFVTVDKNKDYYDDDSEYKRVPELLTTALTKLKENGFDISAVSTETTSSSFNRREVAVALNVFYAGSPVRGWAKGLWPHQGTYSGSLYIEVNGVKIYFSRYQLSSLGKSSSPPGIGTTVHENGHMIMKWADLYPYDNGTNFVGQYCVMGTSSNSNPQIPNPYFRDLAGWIDVTDVTNTNATLAHVANSHTAYKYTRDANESYYIETRRRTGRNSSILGDGLAIWHVHKKGNNTDKAKSGFPLVAVVQANKGTGTPTKDALFQAPNRTVFNNYTTPFAEYHDKTLSDIDISEISAVSNEMTFKIGGNLIMPSSSSAELSSSSSKPSSSSVAEPSSSSEATSIARLPQIGNIRAYAKGNAIILENLLKGTKIEVYSLQGKRIYLTTNQVIPVQANGIYLVRVSGKTLRIVIR